MSNTQLIYAGVGARITPEAICASMVSIGEQLSDKWLLRSGFSGNADMAFGKGAENGQGAFEMYLPWEGFNSAPLNDERFIVPQWTIGLLDIAEQAYNDDPLVRAGHKTNWRGLKDTTKCLMARNVCQLLGRDQKTLSHMLVCWTKDGTDSGGTGQAIRIASMFSIPAFNLYHKQDQLALCQFVENM